MNLIDRDELELDTEWSDYYDGYMSYSQSQINGAVEVQAIPLDRVKQARKEFISKYPKNYMGEPELGGRTCYFSLNEVLEILDEYFTESEGKE